MCGDGCWYVVGGGWGSHWRWNGVLFVHGVIFLDEVFGGCFGCGWMRCGCMDIVLSDVVVVIGGGVKRVDNWLIGDEMD